VSDLGEGLGSRSPSPLFWAKKEDITEGRKTGRASKRNIRHSLAQGLDPPLVTAEAFAIWPENTDVSIT